MDVRVTISLDPGKAGYEGRIWLFNADAEPGTPHMWSMPVSYDGSTDTDDVHAGEHAAHVLQRVLWQLQERLDDEVAVNQLWAP